MNTAGDMNMQPLSRHIQFNVGLLYGVYFFPFAFPFFPFWMCLCVGGWGSVEVRRILQLFSC